MVINNELVTAIRLCDIKKVKLLISLGADVNACHKSLGSPLINALYQKNMPLLNLLIENDVDINKLNRFNMSPLEVAIKLGFRAALPLLLLKGATLHCNTSSFYTRNLASHYNKEKNLTLKNSSQLKQVG